MHERITRKYRTPSLVSQSLLSIVWGAEKWYQPLTVQRIDFPRINISICRFGHYFPFSSFRVMRTRRHHKNRCYFNQIRFQTTFLYPHTIHTHTCTSFYTYVFVLCCVVLYVTEKRLSDRLIHRAYSCMCAGLCYQTILPTLLLTSVSNLSTWWNHRICSDLFKFSFLTYLPTYLPIHLVRQELLTQFMDKVTV